VLEGLELSARGVRLVLGRGIKGGKREMKREDKEYRRVFHDLCAARAHLREMEFQSEVADSNMLAAQKQVWEAEKAFEQATSDLFAKEVA